MPRPDTLKEITDFSSLVAYLRNDLEWEIPDDLPLDKLTYSYTADELGLKLDAQVEITQLRPILGRENAWGVFFVDFDKAELPVTLLRRILSSVSRRKRASADPGDRALFDKNDLLFVSAFGKAEDRRLALAHFHQEPDTTALPTLRVLSWDRQDTTRHMSTVAERLERLRWPDGRELDEVWKARWAAAFMDRPREAIRTALEMAQALADCAKQIRVAIQEILPKEKSGQPLTELFEAVKATLNRDLDVPKFADTYAQTIAYGLLSKRIDQVQRWRAEKARTLDGDLPLKPITADALETAIPTNPFLSELLTSFMGAVGRDAGGTGLDFDELGLGDLIDLLNIANMEAVLDDFDKDKQGDDPVIHFYEGFLAAYDKAMKVQRGVFYTPKPVVSFIVRSVDEVLRTEFGLPLGLADTTTWGQFVSTHAETEIPEGATAEDPVVKILDPATGTGTFLVEVIDLIHRRMMDEAWNGKSADEKRALWNAYVADHLLPRLYGYELMMAPYAVAHMKIGLKLADTGYDFSGMERGPDGRARPTRARVFLTNALEPAQDLGMQLAFMNEALAHEARAANDAKGQARFTAVLGNPPYSLMSGNLGPVQRAMVEPYKFIEGVRQKERGALQAEKNLQDDYVKFLRLGELRIQESGVGVLSYVTNHSYLENPTLRGLRYSFLKTFTQLDFLDLGGSTKRATDAQDENVFEIQQGVAINRVLRAPVHGARTVAAGICRGRQSEKAIWLEGNTFDTAKLTSVHPIEPLYAFEAETSQDGADYRNWPKLDVIMPVLSSAIVTARDALTIGITRDEIVGRAKLFQSLDVEPARERFNLGEDTNDWKIGLAQNDLKQYADVSSKAERIAYRPFDDRWTIYTGKARGFLTNPRFPVMQNLLSGENLAILSCRQQASPGFQHLIVTSKIAEGCCVSNRTREIASVFPLWLVPTQAEERPRLNLSPAFLKSVGELTGLRLDDRSSTGAARPERGHSESTFSARDIFDWTYAVLHSPTYRGRYANYLKSDFARVPLPKDRTLFSELVPLGTKLISLHLLDADALPDQLADPRVRFVPNGGEPRLSRFNKEVRRDSSGRVYLNDQAWFATVPQTAWDHWIGGYQPAQKWLKDRSETGSKDKFKPGRLLTDEDILHYRRMIVALEETGKVMAEIDRVIDQHGSWPDAFRGMEG